MLFIGLEGTTLNAWEISRLRHPFVAGVVLFTRNFASTAQLTALCAAIRHEAPAALICVDHEGGRVQRFRDGFTLLPEAAALGRIYDDDPSLALTLCEACGVIAAYELRRHTIDFTLAPILDLRDDCSAIIGKRAYHAKPETVSALSVAFRRGLGSQGMAAVGKHYPGHGRVVGDSHLMLPCDKRSFAERSADRAPFSANIADGIEGIMVAHIMLPEDTLPAGFSRSCLQNLRNSGFQGAILSDDLDMQGALQIESDPVRRVQLALEAGADAAMICNQFTDIDTVLASAWPVNHASQKRLAALRAQRAHTGGASRYQEAQALFATHHSRLFQ